MKSTTYCSMILLLSISFLLSGCIKESENNNLSMSSEKEAKLIQRISELEEQIAEGSGKEKEALIVRSISEELEKNKQLLSWYEDVLLKLTNTSKPVYEILDSKGTETIVFVKNSPINYESRVIFLIRLALEFPDDKNVVFWRDLEAAKAYAANEIDDEDDQHKLMLGRIRYQENQWILEHFGSTSGPTPIQFGKFADSPTAVKPRTHYESE